MGIRHVLAKAGTRLRHRRPRPAILMYHRVAREFHDPWELSIPPERFETQIAYLKQHRTIVALKDLVREVPGGSLPANAIAITFDDGYRDNLVNALPVLLRSRIPATVFVATGYTGRQEPFWWDELAAMILASPEPVAQTHQCYGQSIELAWGAPELDDRSGRWRAWTKPRAGRQHCYLAIWRRLHDASMEEREAIMKSLRQCLPAVPNPLAMPMNESELREMASSGVVEIGAHTVTHPSLPLLDTVERRREISDSKTMCQAFASGVVDGFAYPFGDVNSAVRDDVAQMQYSWACSTTPGFLDQKEIDVYLLPRIAVRNTPIRSFIETITD